MSHKIRPTSSFGLGSTKAGNNTFSKNHFASTDKLSTEVIEKIASMGLHRVAGNIYVQAASAFEVPSDRSFWEVKNGKVIKLVGSGIVDTGQCMAASDEDDPAFSLRGFLDTLEF